MGDEERHEAEEDNRERNAVIQMSWHSASIADQPDRTSRRRPPIADPRTGEVLRARLLVSTARRVASSKGRYEAHELSISRGLPGHSPGLIGQRSHVLTNAPISHPRGLIRRGKLDPPHLRALEEFQNGDQQANRRNGYGTKGMNMAASPDG